MKRQTQKPEVRASWEVLNSLLNQERLSVKLGFILSKELVALSHNFLSLSSDSILTASLKLIIRYLLLGKFSFLLFRLDS